MCCLHLESKLKPFPRFISGYELPRCLESEDDFARALNRDVPSLTDDQHLAERIRVGRAYAATENRRLYVQMPGVLAYMDAHQWCKLRLDALARERAKRRGSAR